MLVLSEFNVLMSQLMIVHNPYNHKKLVGVMLGCCTALRALQWSLSTSVTAVALVRMKCA